MKKYLFTLIICLFASYSFADSLLYDSFEYGNHDGETPVGWTCNDNSWVCGYLEKDHNRRPHHGNWYVHTNANESWMFMEAPMNSSLKYRYYFWAISDGEYDVEFYAGSGPSSDEMTTLLFTKTVNSGEYHCFSEYIETVAEYYPYFGIHAIAHEGAYYLTMDEIQVDLVVKYAFCATPTTADTVLFPNSQASHHYDVQNLGYEPIEVIISPSHDYFTNIHSYVDGTQCSTFHLEPDETKRVTTEATLLPSIQVGTYCWLDVNLVLDCNCATALTTLLVTVIDPASTAEYPNEEGLQQVELFDLTGKKVDQNHLKPGVYIERTISEKGVSTRKFVKQ